jgi:clan AA aspartic protease
MGLTDVTMSVKHPRGGNKSVSVKMLVDSGATYTVLPEFVWKRLKLRAQETIELSLADGTSVVRGIAEARFSFEGKERTSPVILGIADDLPLLGVVTLENLGLMLNPLKRQLVPIRALLA